MLLAASAGGGASRGQEELSTHAMLVDIWSFVKGFDFCKKEKYCPLVIMVLKYKDPRRFDI